MFNRSKADGEGTRWHARSIIETENGAPRVGNETRPRNLTVNAFIKISRTKKDQKTQIILGEIGRLPEEFIKNKALLNVLDSYVQSAVKAELSKLQQK